MRRSALLGVLLATLAPAFLWAGEGKVRRSPMAVKDEYIVVLNDATPRDTVPAVAARLARETGGKLERVWQDALKGFFVRMNEKQAQGLSHHPDVKYIEENAQMFVSSTVPTNVDPACDPAPGITCTTDDNRLWHLDVMDQNSAVGTKDFSYCETGSGVYVYVIDEGVMRAHREFENSSAKVVDGFDASGDPANLPAWNPCGGPVVFGPPDGALLPQQFIKRSHGTGVASLVNGRNLGVARDAKVVPVKVASCVEYAARKLSRDTPDTDYTTGEIVMAGAAFHRVTQGGRTGSQATYPSQWPTSQTNTCCATWGGVTLQWLGNDGIPRGTTLEMTITGLNWILSPSNPYPKSPAVVSLSTFRLLGEATSVPSNFSNSLEDAIESLLLYNNGQGITVIASANNQNANACDTSPGRMSRNNPNKPADPLKPYKVITAGGTMLRNNPDSNPATGGNANAPEPMYDASKATRFARWRCEGGDSDYCSADINSAQGEPSPPATTSEAYKSWTMGSNGGQCVTLFAPAKNIPVASSVGNSSYRDSRATNGTASGTSWSAPIVAAAAARILQNNTTYTVDQVYDALMARTTPTLDAEKINPPNVTGTPNKVLNLTPIVLQALPATTQISNGTATITVSASSASSLTYTLYLVNSSFDTTTYNSGAGASSIVTGPQTSNTFTVTAQAGTSFWVRATSSCGSADTNITKLVDPPVPVTAPTGVSASATGGTATITWNSVTGADGYRLERKVSSAAWVVVKDVTGVSTVSTTDVPASPSGVVLYRIRARAGSTYSTPSSSDVAYAATFTNDALAIDDAIRAEHVAELRAAVNGLLDIAGQAPLYTSAQVDPNSLRSQPVAATDLTTLMQNLNTARAGVALSARGFSNTMGTGQPIRAADINDLRLCVR
ncbi:MAG: S8 family serine peptidase [Acidobacteriota bacterium]|nr:S8 family serine peptidase [Acidobacteriota bacterium]